ncbi:uncharacterized protein FFB20_15921 [Fusarium fujikuroi]|uniref:Uncharacterized protein n=1 Tax=Gibberella fujikuroi (strain CBS 195.34 / IMI 58289 / NRRL A-6831) TaxID=1279085 RepID=S0DJR6_GIBF5|nr:uncharacterized protein FFUJ_00591 [Fusarium fujikuroi IMI 58289]KLO96093.1 uncharacterized protein Y057_14865 [Fusarium fujikuroi]CCT62819.1 uncharacterized protein FFUJ_00591 [Fusarium fujikuroi IMI 58289]SCN66746.1 uncharacterized protein FFE2_00651 [Fusarium fujikuroi]SCN69717.1 uncharacterized protein FFC1_00647 [Fusarium fujikuroi]SCN73223.1 uncharacterized protein FFM5_00610 [Fusarium fujikuroi]
MLTLLPNSPAISDVIRAAAPAIPSCEIGTFLILGHPQETETPIWSCVYAET